MERRLYSRNIYPFRTKYNRTAEYHSPYERRNNKKCYITDCVAAVLCMLDKGKNGEVYNIANSNTTCSIKEMAKMLCYKYPN